VALRDDDLHRNARRAQAALASAGSLSQVRELSESARTSAEAASALGVDVGQIAKSLVFLADGCPVVVVLSGSDRVSTELLAAELNAREVRRATAEVVKDTTGYPIGGVSPAGLPEDVQALVDRGLDRWDLVWAAAGTPHAVFPTTFGELLRVTRGRAVDVREEPSGPASSPAG